ncbi:MAG: hypothetical protein P1U39_06270 [Legionellaceae bacterium]|nr:hypothetical protein [Legionellaceae bacterium]
MPYILEERQHVFDNMLQRVATRVNQPEAQREILQAFIDSERTALGILPAARSRFFRAAQQRLWSLQNAELPSIAPQALFSPNNHAMEVDSDDEAMDLTRPFEEFTIAPQ